jgi:glycosyltransferase involved in cell wall biosynthesis
MSMEAVKLRAQEEDKVARKADQRPLDISVVIPVCEGHGDVCEAYRQYSRELATSGYTSEFIFVIDGSDPHALESQKRLKELDSAVRVVGLNRSLGEAAALAFGFQKARAPVVVTLPAYFQVEPREINELVKRLAQDDVDLVISQRCPRKESLLGRLRSRIFHRLVSVLTGSNYGDLACGVRAMKRRVAEEVILYGDLHYFFPVLAYQRGFKIAEIAVQPSRHDTGRRLFRPASYLRRGFDLLNLFFLVKFTRKPLRFFGSIGAALFAAGTIIMGYLGAYRLFEGGISHRPLLILGVLLMVVGVQLFSIGLLGELIIFTHAREIKDYQIKDTLDNSSDC